MVSEQLMCQDINLQLKRCVVLFSFSSILIILYTNNAIASNLVWKNKLGTTLGIHFTVPAGQPTTTISSGSSVLWCNLTCTNPSQTYADNQGTGFPVGPGSFTYVCTLNGSACFPAGNLQFVCGGTGSIKITNNYANGHTFTSQCLPVDISSNTLVMITPSVQTMTT